MKNDMDMDGQSFLFFFFFLCDRGHENLRRWGWDVLRVLLLAPPAAILPSSEKNDYYAGSAFRVGNCKMFRTKGHELGNCLSAIQNEKYPTSEKAIFCGSYHQLDAGKP